MGPTPPVFWKKYKKRLFLVALWMSFSRKFAAVRLSDLNCIDRSAGEASDFNSADSRYLLVHYTAQWPIPGNKATFF